jgi:drug/metabolite transporter (DMT)-like permease
MFLILLMQLLYGCTFTISKILIGFAPPMYVIGIRMTLAGGLLSMLALAFTKARKHFDKKSCFYLAQISLFGICLPYLLRYWALQFLPVIKTAVIYNTAPFGTFIFSYFLLKERSSLRKWLGLSVGFLAIFPLLLSGKDIGPKAFGFLSWPEIAMIVAVLSFSYSWVIVKKLIMRTHASPFIINGISMFFGGICALLASYTLETNHTIANPKTFVLWLALIILITNGICYNLYAYLLNRYSATLLSLAGLMAPISAAITSWLYFGETLTMDTVFSAGLVLIGFMLFYFEELKHAAEAIQKAVHDAESKP